MQESNMNKQITAAENQTMVQQDITVRDKPGNIN